jgi:hypothetical protein
MKVTTFSEMVVKAEGKKKSISIAQVKEVLKETNKLLDGKLYFLIRSQK